MIGEWFKKVGDDVGEGELLFSYETDKAVFEEAAKVSGKLLAVFFGVGDDVPCLETVAVIGAEGEDISGVAPKVRPSRSSARKRRRRLPRPQRPCKLRKERGAYRQGRKTRRKG